MHGLTDMLAKAVGCIHPGCATSQMFKIAYVLDVFAQISTFGRLLTMEQLARLAMCSMHARVNDVITEKVVARMDGYETRAVEEAKAAGRKVAEGQIRRNQRMAYRRKEIVAREEMAAVATLRFLPPWDEQRFVAAIAERMGAEAVAPPAPLPEPIVVAKVGAPKAKATPKKVALVGRRSTSGVPAPPHKAVTVGPKPRLSIREWYEGELKKKMAKGEVSQKIGKALLDALRHGDAEIRTRHKHDAPHFVWLALDAKRHHDNLVAEEAAADFRVKVVARAAAPPVEVVIVDEPVSSEVDPAEDITLRSVDTLEISARTLGVIRQNGITTLGGLSARTEQELLALPGFGARSLNETKDALWNVGLKLTPKPPKAKKSASASVAEPPPAETSAETVH